MDQLFILLAKSTVLIMLEYAYTHNYAGIIRQGLVGRQGSGSCRQGSGSPDEVRVLPDKVRVLADEVRVLPDEVRVLPD